MIRVFVASHCQPCQEIKDLLPKVDAGEEVRVVDIETDEGFEEFTRDILSKGDSEVPSAYRGVQKCDILVDWDEKRVVLDCPTEKPLSSGPSG